MHTFTACYTFFREHVQKGAYSTELINVRISNEARWTTVYDNSEAFPIDSMDQQQQLFERIQISAVRLEKIVQERKVSERVSFTLMRMHLQNLLIVCHKDCALFFPPHR